MDAFAVALMRGAPDAYALLSALEAGIPADEADVRDALAQVEALNDPALIKRFVREVERLSARAEQMSAREHEASRQAFLAEIAAAEADDEARPVGVGARDREQGARRRRGSAAGRNGDSDPPRRACSELARQRRACRRARRQAS
jgi:hypothetical protein